MFEQSKENGPSLLERSSEFLVPLVLAAALLSGEPVAARTKLFEYTAIPASCDRADKNKCKTDLQKQFTSIKGELNSLKGQSFADHNIPLLDEGKGLIDQCRVALPILAQYNAEIRSVWDYMERNYPRWKDNPTLRSRIIEPVRNSKTLGGKASDERVLAFIRDKVAESGKELAACQIPQGAVDFLKLFSKKLRDVEQKLHEGQRNAPDTLSAIIELFETDPKVHEEKAAGDALTILKAISPRR